MYPELIVFLFLFMLGATVGSFTNVLIDRIPAHSFFANSRSYCESCKKILKWYDLLPLVSFALLRGQCRSCKKQIPKRIFFVELMMGVVFVLLYTMNLGMPMLALLSVYILSILFVAIFFIDAKHRIIPDSLLLFVLLTTLLYHFAMDHTLVPFLLTGLGSCMFFLLLYLITKGKGLGFGDVKFVFAIGFLLGFPTTIVALYGAFLTGAIVSIILIVIGRKKLRGSAIAFGPFLIVGVVIAALYSDEILKLLF